MDAKIQHTKVIKASIQHLGWSDEYKEALEKLVRTVHLITTHTYLFSRFIFIHEKEADEAFDLRPFINARFFQEVFASLTTRRTQNSTRTAAQILVYQAVINRHLPRYMQVSGYALQMLPNSQQIAQYEATKICTAYINNIQERYGAHLRSVLNNRLKHKTFPHRPLLGHFKRLYALPRDQREEGLNALLQSEASLQQWCAAHAQHGRVITATDIAKMYASLCCTREVLQPVFAHYAVEYAYRQNSIYYDIKANTIDHMNAFWRLSTVSQILDDNAFQVFPVRTSWIPCYMQIDTKILYQHILKQASLVGEPKMEVWARVVDLQRKIFKPRGEERFEGSIFTDGVGVSVLRQNFPSGKNARTTKRKQRKEDSKETGIDAIKAEDKQRLVFIDPNRRDLLYCMAYNSTAAQKQTYRYTLNQRNKEMRLKKYRAIRDRAKTPTIIELETALSQYKHKTLDRGDFEDYLQHRANMERDLLDFYAITFSHSGHPLHRKLKLGSKIQADRSDRRLAQSLKAHFGADVQLVMGDWSSPHQRFHQPSRGIGMRNMLRKAGFAVFVLDEHKTSKVFLSRLIHKHKLLLITLKTKKVCNTCLQPSLETFRDRRNPRPFQRHKRPITRVHGLLRCTTEACKMQQEQHHRLWNRDLVSVCNYRTIVDHQLAHGVRHPAFARA